MKKNEKEYSKIQAKNGGKGGKATLKKHGTTHFSRAGKISGKVRAKKSDGAVPALR